MEELYFIILLVIGYFIYRGLKSSGETGTRQQRQQRRAQPTQRGGQQYQVDDERNRLSFIESAKRQQSLGNFDEASRLFLQAGQVFTAAKMKVLKGPQFAGEAIEMIRANSPDKEETIVRNLANEFYWRREQPATAASLLRQIGLDGEAEAVEVAAGISPVNTSTESSGAHTVPATGSPTSEEFTEQQFKTDNAEVTSETKKKIHVAPEDKERLVKDIDNLLGDSTSQEISSDGENGTSETSYPNTLMMASNILPKNCSACKRKIKSGDSFIYCLNCGHPGHWSHLGEMIKVTGQCPSCKKRLTQSMYKV